MASHRGHDEWMRAALFQVVAHFPDDEREVVDPTAAGGDGDAGARPNERVERCQLRSQRAAWIVETRAIEPLPDFVELRGRGMRAQV